ncbi:MAG: class I SAM-dependent methyltransferase [Fidelibacterota bacterium]
MSTRLPSVKNGFVQFFASVQEAPWYTHFLNLALEELKTLSAGSKVLDVGTGPGKFIELMQDSIDLQCIGVDIDEAMLEQARKRPLLTNVPLVHIKPNQALPFEDKSFEAVTFCSVLFLLENPYDLLNEAIRLLRPGGKIIVLTPTGAGSIRDGLSYLSRRGLNSKTWTFVTWKKATANKAQDWQRAMILSKYARINHVLYNKRIVFGGYAVVESLCKDLIPILTS